MTQTTETIATTTVRDWLDQLVQSLTESHGEAVRDFAIIGIHTGGAVLAHHLHKRLATTRPVGELNISFYRDDFSRVGLHPVVGASDIPFDLEDQTILLVDDVLNTGRTIRAAMNEIFDYGRPARIILAVLIEREGRELPICADAIGQRITLAPNQQIKLDTETLVCQITTLSTAD